MIQRINNLNLEQETDLKLVMNHEEHIIIKKIIIMIIILDLKLQW